MQLYLPLGTRAEALKAVAFVGALRARSHTVFIIATNQDSDSVLSALRQYSITVDYIFEDDYPHTLAAQIDKLRQQLHSIFCCGSPDAVAVIRDTSTAFAAAIAAASAGIFLVHVEAGLRTPSMHSPFSEEFFRRAISRFAKFHLAPTDIEKRNLLNEGVPYEPIFVAQNTIYSLAADFPSNAPKTNNVALVSCHRREISANDVDALLELLQQIAQVHTDLDFIFIVHRRHASRHLEWTKRFPDIRLSLPKPHNELLRILSNSCLVLTDSGSLQEEAAFYGIPTIVLRNESDRSHLIDGRLRVIAGAPNSPDARSQLKDLLEGVIYVLQQDSESI